MNTVPDRKKLRREYLWKKGKASTLACIAGVGFGYFALCFCAYLLMPIFVPEVRGDAFLTFMLISLPLTGGLAWLFGSIARRQAKKATTIPYVPPVTANADNLPAEEVLVRGSEEPLAPQREVLLRATIAEQGTPPEQLLRSSEAE